MASASTSKTEGGKDSFLQELINARRARGWSIRTLAKELGLSPTFVAWVEDGTKKPSVETAGLWAEKLGIDPRRFEGWVQSHKYDVLQEAMSGMAEYRYLQDDPNVTVKIADADQIGFESYLKQMPLRSKGSEVERVPLISEGKDPDSDPPILDYVAVESELLREERLMRPFAYRLSVEGVSRVFKTLKPGDYAIISREARAPERDEIYAVREGKRIVLSRILEQDHNLLMFSDQGEDYIRVLQAKGGKASSLVVGKVAVAIRPLQYTVVKPGGRKPD